MKTIFIQGKWRASYVGQVAWYKSVILYTTWGDTKPDTHDKSQFLT